MSFGGFSQGGWSVPYGDEGFGRLMAEVFDRAGASLLGRRTYDTFAAYRPDATDPAVRAAPGTTPTWINSPRIHRT
ncbi:hypothetical protein AB0K74_15050 [Streptomyces sp. NPDC056159]|uniref:hypothetical protein n=1 Tax=Streptomyces sp. NPDC056159 TaxID=3155537 RepID=UPI0034201D1D